MVEAPPPKKSKRSSQESPTSKEKARDKSPQVTSSSGKPTKKKRLKLKAMAKKGKLSNVRLKSYGLVRKKGKR